MSQPYSDLQVVPNDDGYSGLEHYNDTKAANFDSHKIFDPLAASPDPPKLICGLAPKKFWIVAGVLLLVVIGAAVGGGVGGSLSQKNSDKASTASSSSATSTAQGQTSSGSPTSSATTGPITSSPTNTPALTTTEVAGPSTTLLRDCPSSNNTLYTLNIGTSMTYRKYCNKAFLNTNGIDSWVNVPAKSLDECINLCAAYNVQSKTDIAKGSASVCNAVCWRNTFIDDDFPGQCFGYTSQNSSNAFVVSDNRVCDAAGWIDQKFL